MNKQLRNQIARINRKLQHEFLSLRSTRKYSPDLGDFYVLDTYRNVIVSTHCDPDKLEAELTQGSN